VSGTRALQGGSPPRRTLPVSVSSTREATVLFWIPAFAGMTEGVPGIRGGWGNHNKKTLGTQFSIWSETPLGESPRTLRLCGEILIIHR